MKNRIVTLILTVLVLASAVTVLSAQPRGRMMGDCPKSGPGFNNFKGTPLYEELNLTDEQKDQIETLRIEHQKKMVDLRAELEKFRISQRELRTSNSIDRSQALDIVKQMNAVKNEISVERANHRMDIYELLTDEQKEIWKDHTPRFMGKGRGFNNEERPMRKYREW